MIHCDYEGCNNEGKHKNIRINAMEYSSDLCDKHYKLAVKELEKASKEILNRYQFNKYIDWSD